MVRYDRRKLLVGLSGLLSTAGLSQSLAQGTPTIPKDQWLALAFDNSKSIDTPLYTGRFKDTMYFLTAAISWSPNPDQVGRLAPVIVPTGFVTDLASIPPIFYTWLRPDGVYAFAAVVHDYLYWVQNRPKEQADEILKIAMEDLGVDTLRLNAIYQAVRFFGNGAWKENARLKAQGEKRILAKFPPTAAITWEDWKKQPGVFAP
jgi:hypothetical protein